LQKEGNEKTMKQRLREIAHKLKERDI